MQSLATLFADAFEETFALEKRVLRIDYGMG
jgi:hypothetical protein